MFGCHCSIGDGSSLLALGLSHFVTYQCALRVDQDQDHGMGGLSVVSHLPGKEHTGGTSSPVRGYPLLLPPPPPPLLEPPASFFLMLLALVFACLFKKNMRP